MFYPEEFKKRAMEVYPDNKMLHDFINDGNLYVGQLLREQLPVGVDYDEVIAATSLEELKQSAKMQKSKYELYKEWLKIDQENRKKINQSQG